MMIEVADLAVGYGDRPLLEGLDFTVERGCIFAILGGSGSGKSTVLNTLMGLLPPLAGTVRVAGEPVRPPGMQRPRFGVLFQSDALIGSLTVGDNLVLPLRRWTGLPTAACRDVARVRLDRLGLADAAARLPDQLSGGMAKRAALARALVLDPPLLFLDEPVAGLDPVTAAELDEQIRDAASQLGVTVVMVTHALASVFHIADRCILLDGRRRGIIADGDPRQLRDAATDRDVHCFLNRCSPSETNHG